MPAVAKRDVVIEFWIDNLLSRALNTLEMLDNEVQRLDTQAVSLLEAKLMLTRLLGTYTMRLKTLDSQLSNLSQLRGKDQYDSEIRKVERYLVQIRDQIDDAIARLRVIIGQERDVFEKMSAASSRRSKVVGNADTTYAEYAEQQERLKSDYRKHSQKFNKPHEAFSHAYQKSVAQEQSTIRGKRFLKKSVEEMLRREEIALGRIFNLTHEYFAGRKEWTAKQREKAIRLMNRNISRLQKVEWAEVNSTEEIKSLHKAVIKLRKQMAEERAK